LKIWNIFKSKAGTCPQTSKVEDACISSMGKDTLITLQKSVNLYSSKLSFKLPAAAAASSLKLAH
jgi:hypothetical protein